MLDDTPAEAEGRALGFGGLTLRHDFPIGLIDTDRILGLDQK
jgi:hypothetical protein